MLTGVSETDEAVATVRNTTAARERWFILAGGAGAEQPAVHVATRRQHLRARPGGDTRVSSVQVRQATGVPGSVHRCG
jgi:hypothetical protein